MRLTQFLHKLAITRMRWLLIGSCIQAQAQIHNPGERERNDHGDTESAEAVQLADWDFGDLRHLYAYDAGLALDPAMVEEKTDAKAIYHRVRLRAADGSWIDARVSVPRTEGPHGLFLGEMAAVGGMEVLLEAGFMCANLTPRLVGSRAREGLSMNMGADLMMAVWSRQQTGIDYRRLMDYLFETYPIDPGQVVIAGTSRMGRIAVITAACDPRIRAVIARSSCADWGKLVSGPGASTVMSGFQQKAWYDDEFFRRLTAAIDPLHFARWMADRPVLVQSGELDRVVPPEAAKRLADAVGPQATFRVYPGEDHGLKGGQVNADARAWLEQKGLWSDTPADTSGPGERNLHPEGS